MDKALEIAITWLTERIGKRLARRVILLIGIGLGVSEHILRDKLGFAPKTMRKYHRLSELGDSETIFEDNVFRRPGELDSHRDEIYSSFEINPPKSLEEAQKRIAKLTGIKRSITRIYSYLKKTGFDV